MREIIQVLPTAMQKIAIPEALRSIPYTAFIKLAHANVNGALMTDEQLVDWIYCHAPRDWVNPRTLIVARINAREILAVMTKLIVDTLEENRLDGHGQYKQVIRSLKTYKQTRLILVITLES